MYLLPAVERLTRPVVTVSASSLAILPLPLVDDMCNVYITTHPKVVDLHFTLRVYEVATMILPHCNKRRSSPSPSLISLLVAYRLPPHGNYTFSAMPESRSGPIFR